MTRTLANLEGKLEHLQQVYLISRIAYLEALLRQTAPGMYEVEFDLRKFSPGERTTILSIHANVQAREACEL